MRKIVIGILLGGLFCRAVAFADDLKESKFTQVVNDVQVISTDDNSKHDAQVGAMFKLPDVIRTGSVSRAELVAADRTITRVGANTIFSFDNANRSIHLDRGSLLFNSPKGKGGGNIHTAAATAAVLGTTIIVTTTKDGGFKVLVLEGKAEVKFLNNVMRHLKAGQMIFVLPGSKPGPVVVFRLDEQVAGSRLVNGFDTPLPTLPLINIEIGRQLHLIDKGRAIDTGLLVGNFATPTGVQVINLFNQTGASPGAGQGIVNGLNGTVAGNGFSLPPGFVVPQGLTFNSKTGGFNTSGGLAFISPANGTSGGTPPLLTTAAGPATASLTDFTASGTFSDSPADQARIFTTPVVVIDLDGTHPGLAPSAYFAGFIARNLTFSSAMADLTPFQNLPEFSFLAAGQMTFNGNTSLQHSPNIVTFSAGGGFVFNSESSILCDAQLLFFMSPADLAFDNANVDNNNGSGTTFLNAAGNLTVTDSSFSGDGNSFISLNAGGSVSFIDSFLEANVINVTAGTTLTLSANSDSGGLISTQGIVLLSGTGLTLDISLSANTDTGNIFINNTSGAININNNAAFSANVISVTSGGDINFNNTGTLFISAAGGSTFSALNGTINMQNTTFNGAGNVSILAHTVVLNGVTFTQGSTVNLASFTGIVNTSGIINGDVNINPSDLYGNSTLQSVINQPGSHATSSRLQ